jgi:predicted nucleotidyltransferase
MKLDAVEAVARALNEQGVRFLVVGGLAVAAYGHLRYTADVDIVIQLEPHNVRDAFKALGKAGYRPSVPITAEQFADHALRDRLIAEKGMVVLNFWGERFRDTPVDVFVSEPFDFDREFREGLSQELIPGVMMHFPRIETLIDMKLRAGRDKDLNDVQYLRKIQAD